MDDMLKEFVNDFIVESGEHLDTFNNGILKLENTYLAQQQPEKETLNEIFRSMHTIKGLAGMFGFIRIKDFSHALENILDALRKDKLHLSDRIIDGLYKGLDYLNRLFDEFNGKDISDSDYEGFLVEIRALLIPGNPEVAEVKEEKKLTMPGILREFVSEDEWYSFVPTDNTKSLFWVTGYVTISQINTAQFHKLLDSLGAFLPLPFAVQVQKGIYYDNSMLFLFSQNDIEKEWWTSKDYVFPVSFLVVTDNDYSELCKIIEQQKGLKVIIRPYDCNANEFISVPKEISLDFIDCETPSLDLAQLFLDEIYDKLSDLETVFSAYRKSREYSHEPFEGKDSKEISFFKKIKRKLFEFFYKEKEQHKISISDENAAGIKMFDIEKQEELLFCLRDLFVLLKKKQIFLSCRVLDLLFKSLDIASDALSRNIFESTEHSEIMNKLQKLLEERKIRTQKDIVLTEAVDDFNSNEIAILETAEIYGLNIWHIKIKFLPDLELKPFYAYLILENLKRNGIIVRTSPAISDIENCNEADVLTLEIIYHSTFAHPERLKSEILITDKIEAECITYSILTDERYFNKDNKVPEDVGLNNETPFESTQPLSPNEVQEEVVKKEIDEIHQGSSVPKIVHLAEEDKREKRAANSTIRIDADKLDNLMNMVGELLITSMRYKQLEQDYSHIPNLETELGEVNLQFARVMKFVQNTLIQLRMVPVSQVFSRFPRVVRDMAKEMGKKVSLIIEGEETELDKNIIEQISDPLMHLLRNAIDHGIETVNERINIGKPEEGSIYLNAYHEGNSIVIEVKDDGNGINLEKVQNKAVQQGLITENNTLTEHEILNLLFEPGFSTAEKITDISGRGVGMDVVRRNIEELKGTIEVKSISGEGTCFLLRLPLTLAIIRVLMVQVSTETFCIPLINVQETIRLDTAEILNLARKDAINLRGAVIPLISLSDLFELPATDVQEKKRVFVVIVGIGEKRLALIVEALLGQQEVVIKSLSEMVSSCRGISGATVMGDGRVRLIIDVPSIMKEAKQVQAKWREIKAG